MSPVSATWCSQCFAPAVVAAPVSVLPAGATQGRLLDRRALTLVAAAIGLGAVMQLIGAALGHRSTIEPDALIRYDIVLTLGVYAVVAAMIVSQITPSVRLRWGDGPLAVRVGAGLAVGTVVSGTLLALVSVAAGHLSPDPRVLLIMSEGDPSHIVVAVLIGCVAAPLVEETLFRGLLLEALRPRGAWLAVGASALAFAVWHFMPASLVYYTALGAALGRLYLKHGLAASIAAHVAFNGVLTVAAILVVLGPGHQVDLAGLTVQTPSGWSVESRPGGDPVQLDGPSGSALDVRMAQTPVPVDATAVADQLQTLAGAITSDVQLVPGTVRVVPLAAGDAVEADLVAEGHRGAMVLLPGTGRSYELVFLSGGSVKASSDFRRMLSTLHVD